MTRTRRRSRSSRSKSPSQSSDRPRNDDVEAAMSSVNSTNSEKKPASASLQSAHSGPIGNLTRHGEHDVEPENTGSDLHGTIQDNEEMLHSRHASNRSPAADEGRGSVHNEHAAHPTHPRYPSTIQKEQFVKVTTQEASDPWKECSSRLRDYEESRVKKWKEDIANLLIFSGLFSAILTSFIVPYYVLLQPQQPSASEKALVLISSQLAAISSQLSAFPNSAVHLNATQPIIPSVAALSPLAPIPRTTISTCTLWLMALVCSLGSALIGIIVSQWLHHHGDKTTSTSRQSIRIWFFRDRGFIKWRVQDIINTLPLLLQISVALFLVGLVELLWTMNPIVAGVVTVLVSALLTFSMTTALIPAFAPECPYKSPQAWWCFLIWRWLTKHLETLLKIRRREFFSGLEADEYLLRRMWNSLSLPLTDGSLLANMPTFSGWRDLEYFLVRSQEEEAKDELKMMVRADEILTDETSLPDIISPCVIGSHPAVALPAFYAIMQRRAHETKTLDGSNQPELIWHLVDNDGQLVVALGDMAVNMFARVPNSDRYVGVRPEADRLHILRILENLLDVMPDTQPAAAVYLRLCALADPACLSDCVWKKLAEVIVLCYHQFEANIKDIRPILSAVSSCQDLNPRKFSIGVSRLLENAAKLPRSEFEQIHDELQGALAVVVKYFGPPNAATVADRMIDDWWYSLSRLSCACVELAKLDQGLFAPEFIDVLGQFSLLCPDAYWNWAIRDNLETLRELTGLLPHPEVIPAADLEPVSRTDP